MSIIGKNLGNAISILGKFWSIIDTSLACNNNNYLDSESVKLRSTIKYTRTRIIIISGCDKIK